jgi:hypothetical protein
VHQNRVSRRTFNPKREKAAAHTGQLHTKELHTLCSIPAVLNRGSMDPKGYVRYISYKAEILASIKNTSFAILTIRMWYIYLIICKKLYLITSTMIYKTM